MTDPQRHLVQALVARTHGAARLLATTRAAWASVTFTGERHVLRFHAPGAAAALLTGALEEHEFALPGHIVADIAAVASDDELVEIEALTIEVR